MPEMSKEVGQRPLQQQVRMLVEPERGPIHRLAIQGIASIRLIQRVQYLRRAPDEEGQDHR